MRTREVDAGEHLEDGGLHLRRGAGVSGLAFLLTDLVAILLGGPLPWIDDRPRDIQAFYLENSDRLLAQAFVRGIAMALLIYFGARLAATWGARGPRWLHLVVLAGTTTVAVVELVRNAVVVAVVQVPTAEATLVLHAIGLLLGAVIAFPFAVTQMALAQLARQWDFPRLLAPVGWLIAGGWIVTAVRAVSSSHPWWVAGTVVTFAFGLWLAAFSLLLIQDRRAVLTVDQEA